MEPQRPRSDEELQLLADQVIIGQKTMQDLAHLTVDDRKRVQRVVERGTDGLGELQRRAQLHRRQLRGRLNRSSSGSALVTVASNASTPSLLEHCELDPFCMEKAAAQLPELRLRFLDSLNRKLSERELELWLAELTDGQFAAFMGGIPEIRVERWTEIRSTASTGSEEERSEVQRKVSWEALGVFAETRDPYVTDYRSDLTAQLEALCQGVVAHLGIGERLGALTEQQARLLVGWTSREDLARLEGTLESEHFTLLRKQLPTSAKRELDEGIQHYARRRKESLDEYAEVLAAVKRWAPQVKRARDS